MSKAKLAQSQEYRLFRSWVAQQRVDVTDGGVDATWRYYDFGPKAGSGGAVVPLVFLGGICTTAESFFRQFVSLCPKGYRCIALQPVAMYETHEQFVRGLDLFLAKLELPRVHLFGSQLGGLLAQLYAARYPLRVESLVLCNSFCDTQMFHDSAPCRGMFSIVPEFLLKRHVLAGLPRDAMAANVADAIDFVASEVDASTHTELASKLTLNAVLVTIDPKTVLPGDRVTIMITNDRCVIPLQLREEPRKYYPDARLAILKTGGDFPYLSVADELNMYIEVHLRRFMAPPPEVAQPEAACAPVAGTSAAQESKP
jgi:maspardin